MIGIVLVATFVSAPNLKIGKYLPWALVFSLMRPLHAIGLAMKKKQKQSLISAISAELGQVAPKVLAARIHELFSVDASRALVSCDVPIVYFRGVYDFLVPEKNLNIIRAIRPDIKVVEFKSQHFLLQLNSAEAFKAIQQFELACSRDY